MSRFRFGPPKSEISRDLRQMDPADQVPIGRITTNAVLGRVRPPIRAPDIAVHVGTHSICRALSHLRKHAPLAEALAVHIEDADLREIAVSGSRGLDDVELFLVRRQSEPVGAHEISGDHGSGAACGIDPVDVGRQLKLALRGRLVVSLDSVARIREPDGTVGGHDHIVRRVQRLAVEPVDDHGDAAVVLGARHAARIVLAGDQAAFAIPCVAVGVVRRLPEHADRSVFFVPAHHPVVRDIAPDEATQVPEVHRAFAPPKSRGPAVLSRRSRR